MRLCLFSQGLYILDGADRTIIGWIILRLSAPNLLDNITQ
nr:MAG TPA: hypothetical protein [Caudoviricetes sp.]